MCTVIGHDPHDVHRHVVTIFALVTTSAAPNLPSATAVQKSNKNARSSQSQGKADLSPLDVNSRNIPQISRLVLSWHY
jgi:hypothetical protein